MKAERFVQLVKDGNITPGTVRGKIVGVIVENKDEIFTTDELKERFPDISKNFIYGILTREIKAGNIDKIKVGRKAYYGHKDTIQRIKEEAGLQ